MSIDVILNEGTAQIDTLLIPNYILDDMSKYLKLRFALLLTVGSQNTNIWTWHKYMLKYKFCLFTSHTSYTYSLQPTWWVSWVCVIYGFFGNFISYRRFQWDWPVHEQGPARQANLVKHQCTGGLQLWIAGF